MVEFDLTTASDQQTLCNNPRPLDIISSSLKVDILMRKPKNFMLKVEKMHFEVLKIHKYLYNFKSLNLLTLE